METNTDVGLSVKNVQICLYINMLIFDSTLLPALRGQKTIVYAFLHFMPVCSCLWALPVANLKICADDRREDRYR